MRLPAWLVAWRWHWSSPQQVVNSARSEVLCQALLPGSWGNPGKEHDSTQGGQLSCFWGCFLGGSLKLESGQDEAFDDIINFFDAAAQALHLRMFAEILLDWTCLETVQRVGGQEHPHHHLTARHRQRPEENSRPGGRVLELWSSTPARVHSATETDACCLLPEVDTCPVQARLLKRFFLKMRD